MKIGTKPPRQALSQISDFTYLWALLSSADISSQISMLWMN